MLLESFELLGVDFHFAFFTWESFDEAAMKERWGAERVTIIPHRLRQRHAALWRRILNRTLREIGARRYDPLEIDCYRSPDLAEFVLRVTALTKPNCVMVEYVFNSWLLDLFDSRIRKLIDTHDRFANRSRDLAAARIKVDWFSTTKRQEKLGLNRADAIVAIQREEAEYFRSLANKPVFTIGHIMPVVRQLELKDSNALLFVGSDNAINRDALHFCLEDVWPRIQSRSQNARFHVVGPIGSQIPDSPRGVIVAGEVPFLDEVYRRATVVINPTRFGTGLKIKSIEAMAYGKCLVTTPAGAEGLEEAANKAFLVGRNALELAEHCLNLLNDPTLRARLSVGAIKFVQMLNERNLRALADVIGQPS